MTRRPQPFTQFAKSQLQVKFTPAQLAFAHVVFDGLEPSELPDDLRPLATQLFGDIETVPQQCRRVVAQVKGARVGGTWMWSLFLLYRALTAELRRLAAGELGFCPIVAPKLKTARQALRYALGAARKAPAIAPLITSSSKDGFILSRRDGREVAIECMPASRGGDAVRGVSMVAALMDESSFFRDKDSGVVNDVEIHRAIRPRLLPGDPLAILGIISTAWLESGLLHDYVQRNHPDRGGAPTTALACIATSLLMRPDNPELLADIEAEREIDPENAAREFDCVAFGAGTGQFFPDDAITQCTREDLPLIVDAPQATHGAGCDPAFAAGGDAAALVVVHRDDDVAVVSETDELKGTQARVPGEVCAHWAEIAGRHGVREIASDTHYRESLREHFSKAKISLLEAENTNEGKVVTHTAARDRMLRGKVAISARQRRLIQQLREVLVKRESGGRTRIFSPRKNGSHGDLASAFVLALWALGERAPLLLSNAPPPEFESNLWANMPGRGF